MKNSNKVRTILNFPLIILIVLTIFDISYSITNRRIYKNRIINSEKNKKVELSIGDDYNNKRMFKSVYQLVHLEKLSIYGNRVKTVPEGISNLKELKYLSFSTDKPCFLPTDFSKINKLDTLVISGPILNPENTIFKIKHLTKLMFKSTNILSDDIIYQPETENLSLRSMKDTKKLPSIPNLKSLELRDCPKLIDTIDFSLFPYLEKLDLSGNELTNIPKSIFKILNIKVLILRSNKITSIPSEISKLSKLRYIDFSFNKINEIPLEIGELTNLDSIDFSNNNISYLPSSICQLVNLKSLDLINNYLDSLPNNIGNLSRLNDMRFQWTGKSILPQSFDSLLFVKRYQLKADSIIESVLNDKSTYLNLSGLFLTQLPEKTLNLSMVTSINLSNNLLKKIPKEISKMVNLKYLDLSSNALNSIEFSDSSRPTMPNIQGFVAFDNRISSLDNFPIYFPNIKIVVLNINNITILPDSLFKLPNLTDLYVRYNKLSEFKVPVLKVSKLSTIDLRNNNIAAIDSSIARLSFDKINYTIQCGCTHKNMLHLSGNPLSSQSSKHLPKNMKKLKKSYNSKAFKKDNGE